MHKKERIRSAVFAAPPQIVTPLLVAQTGSASKDQIKRGEYLSILGGCNDCHSPKLMTPTGPQADSARVLSGHPASA